MMIPGSQKARREAEAMAAAQEPSRPRRLRPIRPSQCSVCNHPERVRIETLRVGGASLRVLAVKFNVSADSICRHFKRHVTAARRAELTAGPAMVEELANAAAGESKSLLDYLAIVRAVLFNQFLNAAEAGDRAGVAHVAGRLLDSWITGLRGHHTNCIISRSGYASPWLVFRASPSPARPIT
jgi:hypothetical protein